MEPMTLVLFRYRMRADAPEGYAERSAEIRALAAGAPGFVSIETFHAEDGETLALVTFESEEQSRAWGRHLEHRKAQQEGRDVYYESYSLQVCEPLRESRWKRR